MAIHAGFREWFAAFALMLLVLLPAPVAAQTFPKLTGRVVDQANLLAPNQELDISSKSEALERQSGAQLVVVTLNSLEGRRIEDYSYQLGRAWGIGEEKKDNGVLLVVAPNERKVWIATGYGARVKLTDAVASIIYRNAIIPRFKAGDYPGGIAAGVDEIVKVMQLSPAEAARNASQAQATEQRQPSGGSGGFPFILLVFLFFFVMLPLMRAAGGRRRYRSRRRGGVDPWVVLWGLNELSRGSRGGGWGGGGFGGGGFGGGGGFSGGGGSFGGGGAGGSW